MVEGYSFLTVASYILLRNYILNEMGCFDNIFKTFQKTLSDYNDMKKRKYEMVQSKETNDKLDSII
jgi:hypothetical protein